MSFSNCVAVESTKVGSYVYTNMSTSKIPCNVENPCVTWIWQLSFGVRIPLKYEQTQFLNYSGLIEPTAGLLNLFNTQSMYLRMADYWI